jgi:hypothetical protein
MTEDQETIAKALEIAISLTGANHEWLKADKLGQVLMNKELFITLQNVIRVLKANNLVDMRELGECRVYPDETVPKATIGFHSK